MQQNPQNSVVIVEDEPIIGEALRVLLENNGYRAQHYFNATHLLDNLDQKATPMCFIIDYQLPDLNGEELVTNLRGLGFWQPFFVVSGNATVAAAVNLMQQGAITLIEKPFRDEDILEHLRQAEVLHQTEKARQNVRKLIASLSNRELDVLFAINQGEDASDISDRLGISPKTVAVHKSNIFQKLGVKSTAQAIAITKFFFLEAPDHTS